MSQFSKYKLLNNSKFQCTALKLKTAEQLFQLFPLVDTEVEKARCVSACYS